jgi:alpha-tubulin suppressor-like RCC1 family protein
MQRSLATVMLLLPLAACGTDALVTPPGQDPDPPVGVFVPAGLTTPVRVASGLTYQSVAAGDLHTCALTVAGEARCWGAHAVGVTWTQRTPWPVPVDGDRTYTAIAAGTSHTCASTATGAVYCWGRESPFGPTLGQGSWDLPRRLDTDEPVVGVVSGASFSCGIRNSRAVCWGQNLWGQLGIGSAEPIASIGEVAGDLAFTRLGQTLGHTVCGITRDERLYCWGRADSGQLADAATTTTCHGGDCATTPQPVMPELRFRAVAAGRHHACAVTTDGLAYCWGLNGEYNRLGSNELTATAGSVSATPLRVTTDVRFTDISTGADHSCATSVEGPAYCWGSNAFGQLGAGLDAPWWFASAVLVRIVIVGGGPAGLYLSILMQQADPSHHVTVLERNRADDTFGWGVVFSDQTLENLRLRTSRATTPSRRQLRALGRHRHPLPRPYASRLEPRLQRHRACRKLLQILQQRAA